MTKSVEITPEVKSTIKDFSPLIVPRELSSYLRIRGLATFIYHRLIPGMMEDFQEGRKSIIQISGDPGAGKTFIRSRLRKILDGVFPELGDGLVEHTFERQGRDAAIASGLLSTDPNHKRTKADIELMTSFSAPSLLDLIKSPGTKAVLREGPVIPYLWINDNKGGRYVGVDADSSTFYQLLDPNVAKELPPYRAYEIVSIGGQDLRQFTTERRTRVKSAKSLAELQLIATEFGMTIPQTEEEGRKMIMEGATEETLMLYANSLQDIFLDEQGRVAVRQFQAWKDPDLDSSLMRTSQLVDSTGQIPRMSELPPSIRFREQMKREIGLVNYQFRSPPIRNSDYLTRRNIVAVINNPKGLFGHVNIEDPQYRELITL